jgi:hypothetical protein
MARMTRIIMEWIGYAVASLVSWVAALAMFVGVLKFGYHDGSNDFGALTLWSSIALALAVPLAYLPALEILRRAIGGTTPAVAFPIVGALLGIVPTTIICWFFSGGFAGLLSQTAFWFDVLFGVFGFIFGGCFVLIDRVGERRL